MAKPNWTTIRDILDREISDGSFEPGDQLPTEPELVARFGTGRHSVRRAVEALAKEGKLRIEQGRGMFIEALPRITYVIGRRTRLSENLLPQGYTVTGEELGADVISAEGRVAEALGLAPGDDVLRSRRITRANNLPIAFGASFHDATRFPDFADRRHTLGSTTKVYAEYGITDYVRSETHVYARAARRDEARMLRQHPDMPVMVVRAVDRDLDGAPLSYSDVIWSAARVRFTVVTED